MIESTQDLLLGLLEQLTTGNKDVIILTVFFLN